MEKLAEKHGIEQVFCKEGDHTCNGVVKKLIEARSIKTVINKYFTQTDEELQQSLAAIWKKHRKRLKKMNSWRLYLRD